MKILLVNKYAPPDPSPTAKLLADLATAFEADGHQVHYAAVAADYHRRQAGGIGRWLSELGSLFKLGAATFFSPRPELIIALSSPPCLLLVAALAASWHRCRLIHWVMDLYPEIAVALGALPRPLASIFKFLMRPAYRRCERVVALDTDMQARLRHYGIKADVLPPWFPDEPPIIPETIKQMSSSDLTLLYSGNLGRAHEWQTLLEAQSLLEQDKLPVQLVFQGDGPQFTTARQHARQLGLINCSFRGYADQDQLVTSLLAADVLVATQNPATVGYLWPSKLALVTALPRPILWIGPTDSAVASILATDPANGIFSPGQSTKLTHWCRQLLRENKSSLHTFAPQAIHERIQVSSKSALAKWLTWLHHSKQPDR